MIGWSILGNVSNIGELSSGYIRSFDIWSILGSVSNAIAAVCAVVAICVTVRNFRSDKEEQKKDKLSLKLSELYKQAIIDNVLKIEDEKIRYIDGKLCKMMSAGFDENVMKELSDTMMSNEQECLMEVELIRLFNVELWQEARQITEHIFDTYGKAINKSMQSRRIVTSFNGTINKEWTKLRRSVYECYIKENFDKL